MKRAHKFMVAWLDTVGCYGTDREGLCWSTFWSSSPETCSACGKRIDRGWSRGRLGEESYFCSEHITHPAPNSPGGYKWPLNPRPDGFGPEGLGR